MAPPRRSRFVPVMGEEEQEIRPCSACLTCVQTCPAGALHYHRGVWSLDLALCHYCQLCGTVCPNPLINEASA